MHHLDALTHIPERFPLACQWEITCRCNLHCVMCYTDCFNRPDKIRDELLTHEILELMDELAEAGCLEVCLTGGEPLARPDFFELYERAVRKGFLVTVFTNGTLITKTAADRFAAFPPHRIEISVHGFGEENFEQVTAGHGSYQRCMNAIRLLRERQLPLIVKTTAMTVNMPDVLKIKRFVQQLGSVGYKLGEELRPTLDHDLSPLQLGLSADQLQELNRADPELWQEACWKQTVLPAPCQSGIRSFHIDAYGSLQLCSGNRTQGYDLRSGSFAEGFYRYLPTFACEWKSRRASLLVNPATSHA
ncbi:MAG: radical SAM protein [Nitrospiraceae bacterium]